MEDKSEITQLLHKIKNGSEEAYDKLFPLVYDELKRLAYSKLKKEHKDITYTETALVHEVYMKIADQESLEAEDKSHFFAIAVRCMRRILVDHARKKKAEKRGGDQRDLTYIDELLKVRYKAEELVDLDAKLKELAKLNQRLADVVTLRFFGQMTVPATAEALDVSERTIERDWAKAKGWLYKELKN